MGYEDGTDFQWNSPWTLSNQLGFTDYDPSRSGTFTRGTAAVWAWNALGAETKDNGLLVDVLVRGGAIDPAQGADAGILTGKGGIALSCSFLTRDLADDPDYVLQVWGLPKDAPDRASSGPPPIQKWPLLLRLPTPCGLQMSTCKGRFKESPAVPR